MNFKMFPIENTNDINIYNVGNAFPNPIPQKSLLSPVREIATRLFLFICVIYLCLHTQFFFLMEYSSVGKFGISKVLNQLNWKVDFNLWTKQISKTCINFSGFVLRKKKKRTILMLFHITMFLIEISETNIRKILWKIY